MKIKCILGLHNPMNCKQLVVGVDGYWDEDTRIKVNSFSIFTLVESRYKCSDCKRKFWMPSGDFSEWKIREIIYKMTLDAANNLTRQGKYDEAIKLLRIKQ